MSTRTWAGSLRWCTSRALAARSGGRWTDEPTRNAGCSADAASRACSSSKRAGRTHVAAGSECDVSDLRLSGEQCERIGFGQRQGWVRESLAHWAAPLCDWAASPTQLSPQRRSSLQNDAHGSYHHTQHAHILNTLTCSTRSHAHTLTHSHTQHARIELPRALQLAMPPPCGCSARSLELGSGTCVARQPFFPVGLFAHQVLDTDRERATQLRNESPILHLLRHPGISQ